MQGDVPLGTHLGAPSLAPGMDEDAGSERGQAVALGRADADAVVRNGRVFRPEAGEFARVDLAIADGRVAAQFAESDPTDAAVGPGTTVVDADGRHVVPGFVDAHTHVDVFQTIETSYQHLLAGGTTAIVAESSVFGSVFGAEGFETVLDATADLPLAVRVAVSPLPLVETFDVPTHADADRLCDLLGRDRVCGVGELPWAHVVGRESGVEPLYARAREAGKPISGHGAGCRGRKLQAFASIVDNDHEAVTPEGFRARVGAGIHTVARSGSIRDDLPAFGAAYDGLDGVGECSLGTDGMWPGDLLEAGYMDEVLRRAIDAGVATTDALRMATLAPARHFGFADRGTLAPGSVADVVVLDDLDTVAVDTVLAAGDVVVRDGDPLVEPREYDYPASVRDAVDVTIPDGVCTVPRDAVAGDAVRAIEHRGGLRTAEAVVEPPVRDGAFVADPGADILKLVSVDHHPQRNGDSFAGFLTGYGLASGAAATTVTWETASVVGVGADDADLRTALDRVVAIDGGWVVVEDGEVTAELAMPVGGSCTTRPIAETAGGLSDVASTLRTQGVTADRPLLAVQTLTFTGVPALKLSRVGYADIYKLDTVGLDPGVPDGA